MADYGRQIIGNTGIPLYVECDGLGEWAPIGISIDWSTVAAPGSDVTIQPQGTTVKAGQKYLRHGQVVTRITNQPVQTITQSAALSAGTFTLSGYRLDTGAYVTTAALAYNVSAANMLAALQDIAVFNDTPIAISGGGASPWVITSPLGLLTITPTGIVGGTLSNAVTTAVGNYGMYGPYDSAATDGRQTLTPGQCWIINSLVIQNGILGTVTTLPSNHPGVLGGGDVWKARVLATSGTHSLAAGPTYTELQAAMPRLRYCGNF